MGLIRLVILGLVIWMLWRLVRNFQARQAAADRAKQKSLEQRNMVLCQYCSVHVPENNAIAHDGAWFCSEGHKNKYLAGERQD